MSITTSAVLTKYGYKGVVTVRDGRGKYTLGTNIIRCDKADSLADAAQLKKEIFEQNKL